MKRLGSVVLAVAASLALVLGAVSAPAFAEDPAPAPVVTEEPTSQPTTAPDPTPAPSETPTADLTPSPDATSTPTPTPTPTGASRPGAPAPAPAGTQDITGQVIELSEAAASGAIKAFAVLGEGYLSIDFSAVTLTSEPGALITVRVQAPVGAAVDANGLVPFAALSAPGIPLVATQLLSPSAQSFGLNAMVNQTPSVSATHQIYAVAVTPANVCGSSCSVSSSQSVANIQADVSSANSYWLSQSDGKVGFELVGTTSWYKSAYSCDANTPTNFVNLLNEARLKAAAQIGYVRTSNAHLVLIFPSGSNCGPAIGLGTVGYSVNEGGALWAVGSGQSGAAPTEFHTLAHELGHNLSLGHSNWLDCTSATPAPGVTGTTGCAVKPYGDAADVMGQGYYLYSQGSLSSPHAIRSGMWNSSSYAVAPISSSSYVLKPLSGATGLRSVVVEGNNGVNYFVEFRDTSGIDAPYASLGCPFSTGLCAASTPGVRILQLEQQTFDGGVSFKGFPGDDSYLIGRTVSGVKKVNFVAGESITLAGVTISVTSITGSGAGVTVQRNNYVPSGGSVYIVPTAGSGSSWPWYAGDTLTAMLGSEWKADSYTYTWWRNDFDIVGTGQSYTLTSADVGQYIGVRVSGNKTGSSPVYGMDPDFNDYFGYGPIQSGITQGTVSINASTLPFTAVPAGWNTTGVSYSYQWRRNGAAIAGATGSTYTPVAADDGTFLSVKLTASKAGATAVVAFSASKNYTLTSTGSLATSGTLKVGQALSAVSSLSYATIDGAVSPTFTYQWYRSGETISGATASTYTLAAADLGKLMTVRVNARASGYAPNSVLSTASTAVLRGSIAGSLTAPQVTVNASTLRLTVALPAGSVTESAVTYTYQWYRDDVAVAGATAATYQLSVADIGKAITARVVVTKGAFNSAALYSSPANYSVTASGTLAVQGSPQVGLTLSASPLSYSTSEGAVSPTLSYAWFRNGVAITGAVASTYTQVAADFGTKLSVRVTATQAGFLPHVLTTAQTTAVVKGVLSGDLAVPVVAKSGTLLLSASLPSGSVTDAGTTTAYQWLRDGVAITGATAATFQLTAVDYGKGISVRLTVSKLNYTSAVLTSVPANHSVAAVGTLSVTGSLQVGQAVSASALSYSTSAGAVSPVLSYVWYRNGVAITGATAPTYTQVAADFGTKLSVKVTAALAGFLPHSVTSAPQATAVVKGVLSGDLAVPVVAKSGTLLLSASLPSGSVTDAGTTTAYQWLRDGVAVTGATAATFQLTAVDYGKGISVRLTVSKLNYTSAVLTSVPVNYSLVPSQAIPVFSGYTSTGLELTLVDRTFTAEGASVVPDAVSYQWLRNGVAITGATAVSYTPSTPDIGTMISARVTATFAGYLTSVSTTASTQKVGTGGTMYDVGQQAAVAPGGTTLVLTAVTGIVGPGLPAQAYQWLRDGVAIAGATAINYTLTAADYAKSISVRITSSQAPFTTFVSTSVGKSYSVAAEGVLTVIGTPQVGQPLSVSQLGYTTPDGAVTPTLSYAWLRNGVAISGATASTYTLVAADLGTKLSVRVAGSVAGFLPHSSTSAQAVAAVAGVLAGDRAVPVVSKSASLILSAALPSGSVSDAGTAVAYQWFRNNVAITGATAATFALTSADVGKDIHVRVTVSKLNYTSVVLFSVPANYSVTATGSLSVMGTLQVGSSLSTTALGYATSAGSVSPVLSYVWFRNGVAISGATSASYLLVAADFGTKLSVKVTAAETGFLPVAVTSAPTATAVVKGILSGDLAVPVVAKSGTLLLSASLPSGSVTDAGTTTAYQWLRDGVAVTGATAATFQLTAVDFGKSIAVRATVSRLNYTSAVLTSVAANYSVTATGTLAVEGTVRVGQVVAASALAYSTSEGSVSPILSYVWYRNGVAISAATASTYVLVAADFGTKLSVKVTATQTGFLSHVATSAQTAATAAGVLSGDRAIPVVTKSGTLLLSAALPGGSITDSGTSTAYQWLRDNTAIAGATAATFQLTAADYGKVISARVTVSKFNYTPAVLTSVSANHSVIPSTAVPVFEGAVEQDETLTLVDRSFTAAGDPVAPTPSYQWLRDGVVISGATGASYLQTSTDLGKAISVRVTAAVEGFLSSVSTSTSTQKVGVSSLAGWNQPVTVTQAASPSLLLTAIPGVSEPGTTVAYQWLRNGVAIAGATTVKYTLVTADYGTAVSVRVTSSKTGFTTVVATSAASSYSVAAAGSLTVVGTLQVGQAVSASALSYATSAGAVSPVLSYVWYRNGVVIANATSAEYLLVAADFGTKLSVKVTAAEAGFLPNVLTSVQTALVVKGVLSGDLAVPVVAKSGTLLLSASLPSGSVTDAGTTTAYQWLRDGVAVTGATAATFQLTAVDFGKSIAVRATVSRLNYTSAVLTSVAANYSVTATGTPSVVGALQVGSSLSASALSYSTSAGAVSPVLSYVWYRNGVAISAATASTYVLVAADFGTKLSVKVTATEAGFLANVLTSPQTALAVKGVLAGDYSVPTVAKSGTLLLSASLPSGSVTDTGTALAYQWLRDNVAIIGATTATFQLTAADYGKSIAVRVTVSKLNYTSVVLTSVAANHSVTASGAPTVSGTAQVGFSLSAIAPTYATAAGPISPTVSYQWLRNGVVIAGATASSYTLVAADYATKLSVKLTATEPSYLTAVATSAQTASIAVGVLAGDRGAPTVETNLDTAKLTAALAAGSVTDAGTAIAYQWFRNGVAIAGATAASYTLVGADYGQEIRGRLTMTKLNYTTVTLYTPTVIP